MTSSNKRDTFAGSIPQLYERYMVPLIFESYAVDLAARVAQQQPTRVLEIAAGTGIVTRELSKILPSTSSIIATDLSQEMLDTAATIGTAKNVEWRQADATQLPFPDASFDTVVCQFGVMFFPDKAKAFSEARRVLGKGGKLIFNVWDRIEENEFPHVVHQAMATLYPNNPPTFMARVPHGYYDPAIIAHDLSQGGFATAPEPLTLAARSRASAPLIPALAFCQGTPMRNEIEARGSLSLVEVTDYAAAAIAKQFGSGEIDGKIQAHIYVHDADKGG